MNSTGGTEFPVTEGIGTGARHILSKDITEKFLAEDTGSGYSRVLFQS